MIDLSTFSTAELLQLHTECNKLKIIAGMGIAPTNDEILGVVNTELLGSQLTVLQNHILHILIERGKARL